jgi:hypothetical protein
VDAKTSTTLTVTCPAVAGATSYDIQIATDGYFTQGVQTINTASGSHTFTGLTPNSTYYLRCRGVNGNGAGDWSPTTTVTEPPGATSGPPSVTVGDTWLTATCPAVAGATSYDIQIAFDAGFTQGVQTVNTTTGTFTFQGLFPTTTYYVRCRANSGAGAGDWSNPPIVVTQPPAPGTPVVTPPGAPGAPTVEATSTTVTATCPAVPGAAGYEIQIALNAAFTDGAQSVITPNGTHTFTGLNPNQTYHVRCRAINSGGAGGWGPGASVTTPPAAPGVPSFDLVTGIATCPAVVGATSYEFQLALDPGFTQGIQTGVSATGEYRFTGLTPNTVYYLRCRGVNGNGAGDWSNSISFTSLPAAPGAPGFDPATSVATCPAVAGATRYEFEIGTDELFTAPVSFISDTTTLQIDFEALPPADTYYLRCRGINSGGAGDWSQWIRFFGSLGTILAPDTADTAFPGRGGGHLSATGARELAWLLIPTILAITGIGLLSLQPWQRPIRKTKAHNG